MGILENFKFFHLSIKTETVLLKGHNLCCCGEILKIIPVTLLSGALTYIAGQAVQGQSDQGLLQIQSVFLPKLRVVKSANNLFRLLDSYSN